MEKKRSSKLSGSMLDDLSTETLGLMIRDIGAALLEKGPGRTEAERQAELTAISVMHERRKL